METKYLLAYPQPGGKGRRYVEALGLDAYYPDRTRVSGRPLAGVTLRESTGKPDLSRLRLMAMVPSRSGGMMGIGTSVIVPNSAAGTRKAVRAVRPQEHALLEAIDCQLAELKARRLEVLALAWRRGHHVAVGELRARADGHRQPKDGV